MVKISDLTELASPGSGDFMPIVSAGTTKKTTVAHITNAAAPKAHSHTLVDVSDSKPGATNPNSYGTGYLGVTMDDATSTVPLNNVATMNLALAAQYAGGSFSFPTATSGPVLGDIAIPSGHLYTKGVLRT